jgi:hypothetical protein
VTKIKSQSNSRPHRHFIEHLTGMSEKLPWECNNMRNTRAFWTGGSRRRPGNFQHEATQDQKDQSWGTRSRSTVRGTRTHFKHNRSTADENNTRTRDFTPALGLASWARIAAGTKTQRHNTKIRGLGGGDAHRDGPGLGPCWYWLGDWTRQSRTEERALQGCGLMVKKWQSGRRA